MPILGTALRRFRRVDTVKPDALIIDLDGIAVDDERLAFHEVSGAGRVAQQERKQ